MKLLKYLLATCVAVVLTGGGAKAAESQAYPSSDPNYRIELVDPPADGYEPFADVPLRVHLNNNSGHDLSNVKVNFTLKKKAKNADEPMTTNGIREYIQFKDVPGGYDQSATFTGEYATYQINKQHLGSAAEQFMMHLTYPIGNTYTTIDDISKLDPNWTGYGDSEFEVTFTSGDTVLARQNLILHAKPQNPTYRMTLHEDKDYIVKDIPATANDPISITNAKTRLWIAVSPTSGMVVLDGTKHLTFHLPEGVEFDNERFAKHYPWLNAQVNGNDVSVDVPPYVTGKVWTLDKHKRYHRVMNYNITPYINIPIKILGDVHTPYTFSVDGDMSASVTITAKELKQVDPKSLVKPNVNSYETENGWITPIGVSVNGRNQFMINRAIVDVKQPGMLLKQLSIYNKTAKIYGIKDGKKVELMRTKLTHEPLYYDVDKTSYDFVSGLDAYDKIEVVYDKSVSDSFVTYDFETIDKTKLLQTFPITYNIDDGIDVETSMRIYRSPIGHNLTLNYGDSKFVNTTNGRLYNMYIDSYLNKTPLYGKYNTYLVYKYKKDMRVTHSEYEELIKREIVGDVVYDLTKVIVGWNYSAVRYQIAEFLPSMSDGNHRLTAKAFFNPDTDIPTNYVNANIRQPYDPNQSLKDNYDNSTNKEQVIDFTYESPKRLQVSALLDGSKSKNVTDVTKTMDFAHYIANKSTQDYEDVTGEVVLPKGMYLTEAPTTDSRYNVLYEENGNFVENPNDLASVRKLKIVPKDGTILHIQDVIETHIPVKLTDVTYNQSLTIQSKMVYKGSDTKAQNVSVYVKDPTLADGKVTVNYVMDGKTIKTETITKKHGSAYTVDTADFVNDGKHYEFDHVDGDATGTIVGLTTKDVTVYVRERAFVFDLPTTGTADTVITLSALAGTLVITKRKKSFK